MPAEAITGFATDAEVEALVAGFQDSSLPRERWTHAAHLAVATWHLVWYEADEALDRVREGIQRFNESTGVEQTATGGYHETLTRFYMWAVGESLKRAGPDHPVQELVTRVLAECGDRKLPLEYYSEARLMSWAARTAWVEPDRRPLE